MTSFLSDLKSVTDFRDTTADSRQQQQHGTRFGDGFSPSKIKVINRHDIKIEIPIKNTVAGWHRKQLIKASYLLIYSVNLGVSLNG